MNNLDKIKNAQAKKEKGKKAAEIIWVTVGLVLLLAGFLCLVTSIIINNLGTDTTNMYNSPLYFLVEFQDKFVTWWNAWCYFDIKSFNSLGIVLVIIAAIYLFIVFGIYANKADAAEKKNKARKLRERNTAKFLEDQKAAEEERQAREKAEAEARAAAAPIEAEATEVPAAEQKEETPAEPAPEQ